MSKDHSPHSSLSPIANKARAIRRRSTLLFKSPESQKPASHIQDIIRSFIPRGRWLDFAKIRKWLEECNAQHGNHCRGSQISLSSKDFRPHWLIDVVKSCVVPYHETGSAEYMALSYVWGNTMPLGSTRQLELLRSNQDKLQLYGTLEAESHRIPAAILTAMAVALKLGHRYLWVDRLCIVQDEAATKHSQIYHMASIYSNASLTIVATETADQPLWGVKPEEGGGASLPMAMATWEWTLANSLKSSTWSTRAWTFQELLFSRRAIVFFEDALYCICHCAETEYSELPLRMLPAVDPARRRQLLGSDQLYGWPDLSTYASMVSNYVQRKVSVEIDFLNAYTGLSTTLSPGFFGIHYGLPEVFFDVALLWYPGCSASPTSPGRHALPLVRRSPPHRRGSEPNPLPSWSWMGWYEPYGKLDFWYWHTVNPTFAAAVKGEGEGTNGIGAAPRDEQQNAPLVITRPIVEWHMELASAKGNIDGGTRRVRSNLLAYTTAISAISTTTAAPESPTPTKPGKSTSLPPGWTRNDASTTNSPNSPNSKAKTAVNNTFTFTHDYDPTTIFAHPIPIYKRPIDLDSSSLQEKNPIPILRFTASRAWFNITDPDDPFLQIPESYYDDHDDHDSHDNPSHGLGYDLATSTRSTITSIITATTKNKLRLRRRRGRRRGRPLNIGYLWLHDAGFKQQLRDDTWVNVIAISQGEMTRGEEELNDKLFWAVVQDGKDSIMGTAKPGALLRRGDGVVGRFLERAFSWSHRGGMEGGEGGGGGGGRRRESGRGRGRGRSGSRRSSSSIESSVGSSMGTTRQSLRESLMAGLQEDVVCFYNVLCIKVGPSGTDGREGVAERVGIGTVLKDAFDALAGEERLEVRLG